MKILQLNEILNLKRNAVFKGLNFLTPISLQDHTYLSKPATERCKFILKYV